MNSSANNAPKPDAPPSRTGRRRPSRARRGSLLQWLVGTAIIAFVSLSVAGVFLIPPGEGFDEMLHYSYVSLLADEGRIPLIGKDTIDGSWEERHTRFPEPYNALGSRMTYGEFFEQPDGVRGDAVAQWYGRRDPGEGRIRFQQGSRTNSQAQHPPLYYLTMVPVYKLTAGLPIGHRFLWMRLGSVAIACSSIIFFWLAWRSASGEAQRRLALGIALAVLTPSLVLDIARLGNDSLSMALAAALFWQLLALRNARRPWLTVALIGLLLGLGCLTKGYFPVLTPSVIVAVALVSRRRAGWRTVLAQCALVGMICAAIAGWWHVRSYRISGLWLLTTIELIFQDRPRADIRPLAFMVEFVRGSIVMIATYFYCGTWSWVKIPWAWSLPFGALLGLAAVSFVRRFRSAFLRSWEAAVLVILPALVLGLLWHMWLVIKIYGAGTTPGYYLHVAWPFIALLFGGALLQLRQFWTRALAAASLVGCFIAARAGELAQLLIYGGVAGKDPQGFIAIPDGTGPSAIPEAFRNLGELVPAASGLSFYVLGVAAQLTVLILVAQWLLSSRRWEKSVIQGRAS